jgi:hypothetical protein
VNIVRDSSSSTFWSKWAGLLLAFVFVGATIALSIEAEGPIPEKAAWRYAVVRATAAPFEVAIDGKRVFAAR